MKKAIIEMKHGNIVIELFEKEAPITVGNFEKLIKDGFYNGLKFHRVIPEFLVKRKIIHTFMIEELYQWHIAVKIPVVASFSLY